MENSSVLVLEVFRNCKELLTRLIKLCPFKIVKHCIGDLNVGSIKHKCAQSLVSRQLELRIPPKCARAPKMFANCVQRRGWARAGAGFRGCWVGMRLELRPYSTGPPLRQSPAVARPSATPATLSPYLGPPPLCPPSFLGPKLGEHCLVPPILKGNLYFRPPLVSCCYLSVILSP